MIELLETTTVATVMFMATNADDLVLLTIFFAEPKVRPRDVVIGQLAGIGALTAISYTAAMLALAVPHGWLSWVGLVPLFLGLRWLRRRKASEAPPAITAWWAITGVTMANGADNLGVYIPAFAVQSGKERVITGLVFGALTLLWCAIGRSAARHPNWGPTISRICRRTAPFVLIAIGLWIIAHHPFFASQVAR